MHSTVKEYFHDAILASGIALLDSRIAYRLAPNRWSDDRNCWEAFFASRNKIFAYAAKHARYVFLARVEGLSDPVLGAVMSLDRLQDRLLWITGCHTDEIDVIDRDPFRKPSEPAQTLRTCVPRRSCVVRNQTEDEVLAHHDCAKRGEMLLGIDKLHMS